MKNIIFAGVGGQGVILVGKILMDVAKNSGYDVKESEVHGMAQRGGSVECSVRFGEKVYSPLIEDGTADIVVTLELLESLRKIKYLSPNGVLLVNKMQIDPAPVETGLMKYPEDIESWLGKNIPNSRVIDTTETLKEVGSKKAVNIVMLGALSNHLDFKTEQWENSIKRTVKEKFIEMNLKAFDLGKNL